MKECFMKHPFWLFLIVTRICTMVEVLVRNDRPTVNIKLPEALAERFVEDY